MNKIKFWTLPKHIALCEKYVKSTKFIVVWNCASFMHFPTSITHAYSSYQYCAVKAKTWPRAMMLVHIGKQSHKYRSYWLIMLNAAENHQLKLPKDFTVHVCGLSTAHTHSSYQIWCLPSQLDHRAGMAKACHSTQSTTLRKTDKLTVAIYPSLCRRQSILPF